MAHLRILQISEDAKSSWGGSVKILPGTYRTDRECMDAITEDGDYVFLEVHTVTKNPAAAVSDKDQTTTKKNKNGKSKPEKE